jgi:hypothetical protein
MKILGTMLKPMSMFSSQKSKKIATGMTARMSFLAAQQIQSSISCSFLEETPQLGRLAEPGRGTES